MNLKRRKLFAEHVETHVVIRFAFFLDGGGCCLFDCGFCFGRGRNSERSWISQVRLESGNLEICLVNYDDYNV